MTSPSFDATMWRVPLRIVLFIWLVAGLLFAVTGTLHRLPIPIPILGGGITILVLAILIVSPVWRQRALAHGFRPLIAIHLTRFVGFYFLWLYSLGMLPRNFALPAGWGDNIVALFAIPLLLMRDYRTPGRRVFLILWNLFGLADILMVISMALRLAIADPGFQNAFASLPLSLLPTFIVPLVIASHALMLHVLVGNPTLVPSAFRLR